MYIECDYKTYLGDSLFGNQNIQNWLENVKIQMLATIKKILINAVMMCVSYKVQSLTTITDTR